MERHFALQVYSGDLRRSFDDLIHKLEGIKRISKVLRNEPLADQITTLIHKIENPL
jgi:superfamily II helicase